MDQWWILANSELYKKLSALCEICNITAVFIRAYHRTLSSQYRIAGGAEHPHRTGLPGFILKNW
jgi:hypothetical protein